MIKVTARSPSEVPRSPPKFRVFSLKTQKVSHAYPLWKNSALCLDLSPKNPSFFSVPFVLFIWQPTPMGNFYFLFGDVFLALKEIPLSKLPMALSISIDLIKETCQPKEHCLVDPYSYSPSLLMANAWLWILLFPSALVSWTKQNKYTQNVLSPLLRQPHTYWWTASRTRNSYPNLPPQPPHPPPPVSRPPSFPAFGLAAPLYASPETVAETASWRTAMAWSWRSTMSETSWKKGSASNWDCRKERSASASLTPPPHPCWLLQGL